MKFVVSRLVLAASAACVIACSDFSTSSDETPAAVDGGVDAPTTSGGGACTPDVFDPSTPPACLDGRADLLASDAQNCGACARVCADGATCADSQCAPVKLSASVATSIALIGTNLYVAHAADTDVGVIDLTAPAPTEQSFLIGTFIAPFRKMTAFGGKLWVSTQKEQAVVETNKAVSANPLIPAAGISELGGIFFPGAVAYYVYPALDRSKTAIARFSGGVSKDLGSAAISAFDVHDGEMAYAIGVSVSRVPDTHVIQSGTTLAALGVSRDYVWFAENGFVIRAAADKAENVAVEAGTGVMFQVVGDTLYYAAHRKSDLRERDVLVRVRTCGGRSLVLYDHGGSTINDFVVADQYAYIANSDGVFRVQL